MNIISIVTPEVFVEGQIIFSNTTKLGEGHLPFCPNACLADSWIFSRTGSVYFSKVSPEYLTRQPSVINVSDTNYKHRGKKS